jgi:signal transduction histidine kinase
MNQLDGASTTLPRADGDWRGMAPPLVDVVIAVVLGVLLIAEASGNAYGVPFPAVFLPPVALLWRRQQPLPVFFLTVLGVMAVAHYAPYTSLTAAMIAAYSVGAYTKRRLVSLGVILATATLVLAVFGGALPSIPHFAGPYLVLVPFWLAGNAIQSRQLRADTFQSKASRLEREQEYATRQAMADERARIARELHDVVAHSVSVMLVQAGAARHVLGTAPHRASEALLAVEASGREAMTELRHLLGVLSQEADDVSLAPQPGVEHVEALVRRVGDAGLPVRLYIEGRPRPLPPGIDLTAYRIVQEALTNALKYAEQANTEVVLGYRDHELKVEILDEGNGTAHNGNAPGHGLVGMRERVVLFGGTFEAGPRLERGYAVRAWLPLEGARG